MILKKDVIFNEDAHWKWESYNQSSQVIEGDKVFPNEAASQPLADIISHSPGNSSNINLSGSNLTLMVPDLQDSNETPPQKFRSFSTIYETCLLYLVQIQLALRKLQQKWNGGVQWKKILWK